MKTRFIDIVFTEMLDGGKDFVEVEDETGASITLGEWVQRPDGYSVLRIPDSTGTLEHVKKELRAMADSLDDHITPGDMHRALEVLLEELA